MPFGIVFVKSFALPLCAQLADCAAILDFGPRSPLTKPECRQL